MIHKNSELPEGTISELQTPNSELDADFIEISIEDSGIGIHQEDMGKLFTAFGRIYIKDKPVIEGAGLGLYLSKKIVDMLGGEIKAESEFGKGSKFTFKIPVKNSEK